MRITAILALVILSGAVSERLKAQGVSAGYVFAGGTFGSIEGAGRFGAGLDFHVAPHLDLGGEIGLIDKTNVGLVASGDVTYHFSRRRAGWDPFLTGGVSGARIYGLSGAYVNLGAGANYWVAHRIALRGEFKGYAFGQSLGGFTELRFGIAFRPAE